MFSRKTASNMPHNKNIIHIIGHIIYVALYGLLIVFSILFYNSASLIATLYAGWITLALVLIAQHPVSLVTGTLLIILLWLAIVEEEKRDIEKFGDAYKEYMQKVPRVNLLVGVIRQMYRERENEKG